MCADWLPDATAAPSRDVQSRKHKRALAYSQAAEITLRIKLAGRFAAVRRETASPTSEDAYCGLDKSG